MPAESLHVSQMKGFVPPPSERVNTPATMQAASERAAEKANKADDAESEQSSTDAADTEQEN